MKDFNWRVALESTTLVEKILLDTSCNSVSFSHNKLELTGCLPGNIDGFIFFRFFRLDLPPEVSMYLYIAKWSCQRMWQKWGSQPMIADSLILNR